MESESGPPLPLEQQQQPQQPHPVQPILRKRPHTDGVVNHVRIVPTPTGCDDDGLDDHWAAEPSVDRENPFRPGSELDREADSLLRNSRISRNSVHLPRTPTTPTAASGAPPPDGSVREDTVSLLTPSTAVAAVIPDDATDSGPEEEPPTFGHDSNGSTAAELAKAKEAAATEAVATEVTRVAVAGSQATAPSKAEEVQLKDGRACCDLM